VPGMGLTNRQKELLTYLSAREMCPTYDEMRQAIGVNSRTSILWLVNQLEKRGHIRRLRNRVRAIEVLKPLPSRTIFINGERYRWVPKTRAEA